ncbi:prepilin-type N-terminal cleavage/methylation domain-containing protein [uncultured Jatrophihabitans sp.]|uniref:prepilin-type N-terminal cleavage/methylation domain-containing protein n=1 Tax=uncultured Jatrophihabitans sp. TaxID=1610747 RepID=UPI0035CB1494
MARVKGPQSAFLAEPVKAQEASMLHNRLAQLREERAEGDRGFTLIELLVVVVIIGILIAIAIPLYLNYKKGAADKSTASDVRNAINVIEQCNSDNGKYPTQTFADQTASFALGSATVDTACQTQTVNLSSGTKMTYVPKADYSAYSIEAYNTNGNTSATKYYCYTSAKGGQVNTVSGTYSNSTYTATC